MPTLTALQAPLTNWTTYLSNVNLIAYGDGAIAAGEAYRRYVANPLPVGSALTDDRAITWDPIIGTEQVQTGVQKKVSCALGVCITTYSGGTPVVYPEHTAGQPPAPDSVTPGGVVDLTLLTLTLLRNPGRANGGLYARFAPIYEELTDIDPVSPKAVNVLPDGVDPDMLTQILTGALGGENGDGAGDSPGFDSAGDLVAIVNGIDGQPVLITLKTDLTWEYDLLSDAPASANPIAWANSAVSSLLVFNLAGSLLSATDPTNSQEGGLPGFVAYLDPNDNTFYGTLTTAGLPLLSPIRTLAGLLGTATGQTINTPLADALEPMLKILTNVAYTDVVSPVDLEDGTYDPAEYSAYDRTLKKMGDSALFGTQTLNRTERAQLAGDLITALGSGIGHELTDINTRALARIREALSKLNVDLPQQVNDFLDRVAPAPGNLLTKVSTDLGTGVSKVLRDLDAKLPDEPDPLSQTQLANLQRPVGKALRPVKDVTDAVGTQVQKSLEQIQDRVEGSTNNEGTQLVSDGNAPQGLVAGKSIVKTTDQQTMRKTPVKDALKKARADMKAKAKANRAEVKKVVTKIKSDIKKALKPKPKEKAKKTSDE